jgi:hypothetical protein
MLTRLENQDRDLSPPPGWQPEAADVPIDRCQIEAVCNVLRPAADDERAHQALVQLGFRF